MVIVSVRLLAREVNSQLKAIATKVSTGEAFFDIVSILRGEKPEQHELA